MLKLISISNVSLQIFLGYLSRREVKIREHEDQIRAKRDILLKEDSDRRQRLELTSLAKEVGMPADELLASAGLGPAPAKKH